MELVKSKTPVSELGALGTQEFGRDCIIALLMRVSSFECCLNGNFAISTPWTLNLKRAGHL